MGKDFNGKLNDMSTIRGRYFNDKLTICLCCTTLLCNASQQVLQQLVMAYNDLSELFFDIFMEE